MSPSLTSPGIVLFSPDDSPLPIHLHAWVDSRRSPVFHVRQADELMAMALRARPRIVIFDGRLSEETARAACCRMKSDSYTGVVPALLVAGETENHLAAALDSGADEVLDFSMSAGDAVRRLDAMLARSDRDLGVHPSTRLPGAGAIETEITRRLDGRDLFAVCYADLDHFKEYNDRYSYYEGDRVIRILAMLLHDVVKGMFGEYAFVGHIGGDDFIFIIPYDGIADVCDEITATFDLLVPYQYSEPDRRAGYFFGKDRRGVLDGVPLMTLSIGIVTNVQRTFKEARQVSRLATEMKTYAKTLSGSVYSIDRRTDDRPPSFERPQDKPLEGREQE